MTGKSPPGGGARVSRTRSGRVTFISNHEAERRIAFGRRSLDKPEGIPPSQWINNGVPLLELSLPCACIY
ncbi:hypothetical protein OPV22_034514 [Ensete ventricosum]|uniref:Uncharacterized protein n=1 Tax=Ensete ventricosum TaxID=4639 RepID=A0AAV8PX92_ENSVE|nr:hypothetical protein OPV22_034514 [Ensete ventricosum]